MSASHNVFPDLSLGVVRLEGTVVGDDLADVIVALYADERWDPGFSTLWDARGIRELIILPEDLPRIGEASARTRPRQGNGRLAGLVRRNLDNELGRLLLTLRKSEDRETQIFWTISQAAEWLAIPTLADVVPA